MNMILWAITILLSFRDEYGLRERMDVHLTHTHGLGWDGLAPRPW